MYYEAFTRLDGNNIRRAVINKVEVIKVFNKHKSLVKFIENIIGPAKKEEQEKEYYSFHNLFLSLTDAKCYLIRSFFEGEPI